MIICWWKNIRKNTIAFCWYLFFNEVSRVSLWYENKKGIQLLKWADIPTWNKIPKKVIEIHEVFFKPQWQWNVYRYQHMSCCMIENLELWWIFHYQAKYFKTITFWYILIFCTYLSLGNEMIVLDVVGEQAFLWKWI